MTDDAAQPPAPTPPPAASDDAAGLRRELAALRRRVDSLSRRSPAAAPPLAGLPFPGRALVFPARDGDDAGTWQELAADGADLDDMPGGRVGGDGDAPIELDGDQYALLAMPDADGSRVRYVRLGGAAASITMRIASHAQDGANKRWKYTGVEVEKTAVGYGGWTDKAGGRVATGTGGGGNGVYVYNRIEDQNGATGVYGDGVSSVNLASSGFDIQPIPTGTPVRVEVVTFTVVVDGAGVTVTEYWCDYENGIDGSCA